jgi:hypothetical protein
MSDASRVDVVATRSFLETIVSDPPDRAAVAEFDSSWGALVTALCVDPAARMELADLAPAIAARADDLDGAHWVAELLTVLHEEPFVAIEPATSAALIGHLSGIADNFQLHTLLMDEMPPASRVSPSVAATVRGSGPQMIDETVTGAWNLYTYAAIRDGRILEAHAPGKHWIWNEGAPRDIPKVDGHRVVLLGPPAYERTWEAVRTFEPLRAQLNARTLDDAETASWLRRISMHADSHGASCLGGSLR